MCFSCQPSINFSCLKLMTCTNPDAGFVFDVRLRERSLAMPWLFRMIRLQDTKDTKNHNERWVFSRESLWGKRNCPIVELLLQKLVQFILGLHQHVHGLSFLPACGVNRPKPVPCEHERFRCQQPAVRVVATKLSA